jgi:hypothetical protein
MASYTVPSALPSRRGSASVEFGMVLPFLLMLILGLFDAGWIFYHHGVLTRAVRTGCRAGAVADAEGDPQATAVAAITQLLEEWHYACPADGICEPVVTVLTDAQGRPQLSCTVAAPVSSITGYMLPADGLTLNTATRTFVENWSGT